GDNGNAAWCQAELLRLRGDRVLVTDAASAEGFYLRSLELARRTGTLAWELRASVSIGQLWQRLGRARDAFEQLESVLSRVQEGFSCPDFRSAHSLYDSLAGLIGTRAKEFPRSDPVVIQALPDSVAGLIQSRPMSTHA